MISIICPSNNKKILDNMLVSSLNEQTYKDFELIVINSKEKGFTSAAETLNYGASLAKGEILVFCHQDIKLLDKKFLEKLVDLSNSNDFGIAGVAGIANDNLVYSNIYHGKNTNKFVGINATNVMNLISVDECLFIIKKENFCGFDTTNKTWHLYAVDYSYCSLKKNENVLLFPLLLYHLSPGDSLNDSFYDELKILGRKHKELKYIKTTMIILKNDRLYNLRVFYRKYRHKLKNLLKRKAND